MDTLKEDEILYNSQMNSIKEYTDFFTAVKYGYLNFVKKMVESGIDIHFDNEYAFRLSAKRGHIDVVKYLVEQGSDIHAQDEYAFRYASKNGHIDVVKFLFEKGANIYIHDYFSIMEATSNGHLEIVKFLEEQGHPPPFGGDLLIILRKIRGDYVLIYQHYIERYKQYFFFSKSIALILHHMITENHLQSCKYFLDF